MSGDINRLPKWAQYRIQNLESELARVRKELGQAMGESDELTDTRRVELSGNIQQHNLPNGSIVRFDFMTGWHDDFIECKIMTHERTGAKWLRVMGGHRIEIQPDAANAIKIVMEERK